MFHWLWLVAAVQFGVFIGIALMALLQMSRGTDIEQGAPGEVTS